MASILVLDHDPAVRDLLREVLQTAGHRVSEAVNGITGAQFHRRRLFDLVLCDVFMAGQDGLRELQRYFPEAKLICMSTNGDYVKTAKLPGVDATLPKPINEAALLDTVREALSSNHE